MRLVDTRSVCWLAKSNVLAQSDNDDERTPTTHLVADYMCSYNICVLTLPLDEERESNDNIKKTPGLNVFG